MRTTRRIPILIGLATVIGIGCTTGTEPGNVPSGDVAIVQGASTKGANAFSPNPYSESFATKASVKWVNADVGTGGYGGSGGVTHHLVSNTALFDSGTLGPGSTYTFTFAGAGSYPYHCTIHPTMTGTITLTP